MYVCMYVYMYVCIYVCMYVCIYVILLKSLFLFSIQWPAHTAVARCPHCRGRSYINYSWMKYRSMFCALLGLFFIFAGCIVTVRLSICLSACHF